MKRRISRIVRITALLFIVFGPYAAVTVMARWYSPRVYGVMPFARAADAASRGRAVAADTVLTDAESRVAAYLERRSPALDRLLPEGAGGTWFHKRLWGSAGVAVPSTGTIGLMAGGKGAGLAESVEIHERAHLLDAYAPVAVARLMRRVPAPQAGEYAAKSAAEHFAEMAAQAWNLVAPEEGEFCSAVTRAELLHDAESRVPGTSGFVVRFLELGMLAESPERDSLFAEARRMSAPYAAEFAAIWRALDSRRNADGRFETWPQPTAREYLDGARAGARVRGDVRGWLVWVLFAPSAGVARVVG